MRWFTEADVARLLPMAEAIEAVEEAFVLVADGQAESLPRQRVKMSTRMFHNMFSGSERLGYAGLKTYTVGRQGSSFHYLLYEASSGKLVAMMEADLLGQIRTGAASGVASRWLSRESSDTLGIIGTGWQARAQLEAVCAVRPIRKIVAFGRDEARRRSFCAEMSERLERDVTPVSEAEITATMDIIVTATTSRVPVLAGAWLRPGHHVNAVGSNFAHRRELDDDAIDKATHLVVDDLEQAKLECGDLLPAIQSGRRRWEDVLSLAELVASRKRPDGENRWTRKAEDITVFVSQGVAVEDLVVAKRVYERGVANEIGRELL